MEGGRREGEKEKRKKRKKPCNFHVTAMYALDGVKMPCKRHVSFPLCFSNGVRVEGAGETKVQTWNYSQRELKLRVFL